MKICVATQEDHKRLCEIARGHYAGSGFSHFMFSGEAAYQKGWIRVAVTDIEMGNLPAGTIVGFTCVRQKVRQPETKLYYILVDPRVRRAGIGQLLLDDLIASSPSRKIALDCLKNNAEALAFYRKNGFDIVGESLKGKGHHLSKHW